MACDGNDSDGFPEWLNDYILEPVWLLEQRVNPLDLCWFGLWFARSPNSVVHSPGSIVLDRA